MELFLILSLPDKVAEMNELVRSTIILNLSGSVIRKVGSIESSFDL